MVHENMILKLRKKKYQQAIEKTSEEDSSGILPVLTIGGIGAGIYYYKKKKK